MSQMLDHIMEFPTRIQEMLEVLLERNQPDGVIPQPLLQRIVSESWAGKGATFGSYMDWKDDEGNVVIQHLDIIKPGNGVHEWTRHRFLDMKGLVRGNPQNKYAWPMACAVCIIADLDNVVHSTPEERQWWEWGSGGGNYILITHDYEGKGQFRYWVNPDD